MLSWNWKNVFRYVIHILSFLTNEYVIRYITI